MNTDERPGIYRCDQRRFLEERETTASTAAVQPKVEVARSIAWARLRRRLRMSILNEMDQEGIAAGWPVTYITGLRRVAGLLRRAKVKQPGENAHSC
jgi:predicted ATPase with chaperone activity